MLSPFCRGTISTSSSKSIPVCPEGFWSCSEKIEGVASPSSARHSESSSKARVNGFMPRNDINLLISCVSVN